jgi:hypothetical protein
MATDSLLSIILIALAVGAVTETTARIFRFWIYPNLLTPALNVIVVFGGVQGAAIAWGIGHGQALASIWPVLFMTGAVVGVLYEGLNTYRLHAWSWPETPLFGLRRPIDKAAVVGVSWGFTPVTMLIATRLISGSAL